MGQDEKGNIIGGLDTDGPDSLVSGADGGFDGGFDGFDGFDGGFEGFGGSCGGLDGFDDSAVGVVESGGSRAQKRR